jgi:adenine deaminase
VRANIWIDGDRIVYVGDRLPARLDKSTEQTDCSERILVPGYVEPHVHPGQIYNPQTLAAYAAALGTTTLICDNAIFFRSLPDQSAFDLLERLDQLPTLFYWWCRYDPQTAAADAPFNDERVNLWLNNPRVIQGGELTDWPRVVHGDDQILSWMRSTKLLGKPIESHLPGASERTLTELKLFGADCDHEAMTGEEAIMRLRLGYHVSLRYSSIRPDLPELIREMLAGGIRDFHRVFMTRDGATPVFLKDGLCDRMIKIALDAGVPAADAYMMASSNSADYYHLGDRIGHIAPGRLASINFLDAPSDPRPVSVLAKGQWVVKEGKSATDYFSSFNIDDDLRGKPVTLTLSEKNLKAKTTIGIEMVDHVITRSFSLHHEPEVPLPEDVLYLSLADKKGDWIVNSYLRGFAPGLSGFAGSYSTTGDIILIGKNKSDMLYACARLKELRGGLVIAEKGRITDELALPVLGCMSALHMEELIRQSARFTDSLRRCGYSFIDPFFSLSFLASTHLPYIRITPQGLIDVMKRKLLVASERLK